MWSTFKCTGVSVFELSIVQLSSSWSSHKTAMKWGSIGKVFALVAVAVVVIALCACPVPAPLIAALVCVAVYACYAAAQEIAVSTEIGGNYVPLPWKEQPAPARVHDNQALRDWQLSPGMPCTRAKGL